MRTIEVTVEVTRRYCEDVEITDEQYEALVNGDLDGLDIPQIDWPGLYNECRVGDGYEETDYAIVDDVGRDIVPWG